ncbi:MAG: hypothetical protein L6277_08130, partial [Desulfobacterales bacterium]|nr:hypothetical protein [Pseudomonadota bacterium]MCG2772040.1 hypothetical protein [Desulfobacterales bacterium]
IPSYHNQTVMAIYKLFTSSRIAKNLPGRRSLSPKGSAAGRSLLYLAMIDNYPLTRKNPDMIWIAKLTFCGGISRIIFYPMILWFDGEVVWSNLDQYTLRRKGVSWQRTSR